MAVIRDRITVFPPEGETVVVDIKSGGVSLGTAHAERTTSRTLTLPLSISERTSFYVPRGAYSVSVKLDGVEIAGDGAEVTVSSFPAEVRATVNAAETSDVVTAEGGGSGGSVPEGAPVYRAFSFDHSTPGLVAGHAVYTPTIGDLLLDAWIEVDAAWNGTTPKADFGYFDPGNDGGVGLLGLTWGAVDLTAADVAGRLGLGLLNGNDSSNATIAQQAVSYALPGGPSRGAVPSKFATADPIKVCVSADGSVNGSASGATAGSATLYLVTVTPAT